MKKPTFLAILCALVFFLAGCFVSMLGSADPSRAEEALLLLSLPMILVGIGVVGLRAAQVHLWLLLRGALTGLAAWWLVAFVMIALHDRDGVVIVVGAAAWLIGVGLRAWGLRDEAPRAVPARQRLLAAGALLLALLALGAALALPAASHPALLVGAGGVVLFSALAALTALEPGRTLKAILGVPLGGGPRDPAESLRPLRVQALGRSPGRRPDGSVSIFLQNVLITRDGAALQEGSRAVKIGPGSTVSFAPPEIAEPHWRLSLDGAGDRGVLLKTPTLPSEALPDLVRALDLLAARHGCELRSPWSSRAPGRPEPFRAALQYALDTPAEDDLAPAALVEDRWPEATCYHLSRFESHDPELTHWHERLALAALLACGVAPLAAVALALRRARLRPLVLEVRPQGLAVDGRLLPWEAIRICSILPVHHGPPILATEDLAVALHGLHDYKERVRFGRHLLTRAAAHLGDEQAQRDLHRPLQPAAPTARPARPFPVAGLFTAGLGAVATGIGLVGLSWFWATWWALEPHLVPGDGWIVGDLFRKAMLSLSVEGYAPLSLFVMVIGLLILALNTSDPLEGTRRAPLAPLAALSLVFVTCFVGAALHPLVPLRGNMMAGLRIPKADLRGLDLREASFRGADLSEARLDRAQLDDADLRGLSFYKGSMPRASLQRARMKGILAWGVNLRGADLRGADLEGAWMVNADLRGANLKGANLINARLDDARWDKAVCPDGKRSEAHQGVCPIPTPR